MQKLLTKTTYTLLLVLAFVTSAFAQSNPTPFDLSGGNYSMDTWSKTSGAGTYPTSMILHTTPTLDAQITATFDKDWTAAYNLTSKARFEGADDNGIYFLNTSSTNSGQGFMGEIVLAINTMGRTQVNVNWVGGFVSIDNTTSRQYALRMQYRIGETGNWSDLAGQEYMNTAYLTGGTSTPADSKNFATELPSSCENQPIVQLRWVFYQVSGSGGSRPKYRLDDVVVSSEDPIGTPTQIIVKDYTPENPMVNIPFSVTLQAVDNGGVPKYVSQNTSIKATLYYGNGTLAGTTTKSILAGTHSVTFDNLLYNIAEGMQIKFEVVSGDVLESVKHNSYVQYAPSKANIVDLYTKGHSTLVHHPFSVQVVNADGTPNEYYDDYTILLNLVSGPAALQGTTAQKTKDGIANFNDIIFPVAGTYIINASAPGLPNTSSITVNVLDIPTFTTLIIPQYIKGNGTFLPSGNGRMASYALVKFDGLHPNTEYTFTTAGLASFDLSNPTSYGAGNNIYYDYKTDSYTYTSDATDITDPANRSVIKTGASQTSLTFWVNLVPTSNSRFTNLSNQINWLVNLGNEFGELVSRNISATTSSQLAFGTSSTNASGIYDDNSRLDPKTYLVFYDVNDNPVTTAIVQEDGSTLITPGYPHQSPAYFENLDNVNGAWGTFLPNDLPSGITKIEQITFDGVLAFTWTDDDAVWNGIDTKNPSVGSEGFAFGTPHISFMNLVDDYAICNNGIYNIEFDAHGVYSATMQVSLDGGNIWSTIFTGLEVSEGINSYEWKVQRSTWADKPLQFRIYSDEHPYVMDEANDVMIYDLPVIERHSHGEVYCIGSEVTIETIATGSGLTYQWYRDGEAIVGANLPYLYFASIDYKNTGIYHCVVGGAAVCQTTETEGIVVYVARPTAIGKEPETMFVNIGGTAYFEVDPAANGFPEHYTFNYQWKVDGVPMVDNTRIQGTTSRKLVFNSVLFGDLNKSYTCTITALCGEATSQPALLSQFEISYEIQPEAQRVCEGNDVKFTALIANDSSLTLNYQWMKGSYRLTDNERISGSNTTELTITNANASDIGAYQLVAEVVEKGYSLKSKTATLFVIETPKIISQPTEVDVAEGRDLIIPVVVSSNTDDLTFTWKKDGTVIDGQTTATLTLVAVTTNDAGIYTLTVTTECGEITSADIKVTVTTPGIMGVDEVISGEQFLSNPTPNPASSIANISFFVPNNTMATITITDLYGNQIATIFEAEINGMNNISVNANQLNLANGIYFVNLQSKYGISTQKFVVIK